MSSFRIKMPPFLSSSSGTGSLPGVLHRSLAITTKKSDYNGYTISERLIKQNETVRIEVFAP